MSRELEDFRPYMEDILVYTNGSRVLTAKQAQEYTGKSKQWFISRGIRGPVGAVQLARLMAALNRGGC